MIEIRDLNAYYGRSRILAGVDLVLAPGETLALLGRNGSGRSTLAGAVMGLVERTGSVCVDGTETAGLPPHKVVGAGVALVPEGRDIFAGLTVDENLRIAKPHKDREPIWNRDEIYARFPHLDARRTVDAAALSGGEKQILSICRSLLTAPRYLLIDEPTEGLAPQIVQQIAALIGEVAAAGIGILLIEQKQAIAHAVADRLAVLGKGEIVFTGTWEALREAPEIRKTWIEVE